MDQMHKAGDFPPEFLSIARLRSASLIISPRELRDRILKIYNENWDLPNVYEGARASVLERSPLRDRFVVKTRPW